MRKLLVVLLVLGLASPVMAADWYFYGSIRNHLGYYSQDENFSGGVTRGLDETIAATDTSDDAGTVLNLSAQSRFGAKAVASDQLYGVMELGLGTANTTYLRLLYGSWNFGPGKLIVGKNYTPATFLGYSSMDGDVGASGDANLLVSGLPFISRQPLIELQLGTFELALIQHNSGAGWDAIGVLPPYSDPDFNIPRIEAAYVFRTPVVAIRPVAAFQTYDVTLDATGEDKSVTSYMGGLGVSLTLGPAYIKATGAYYQNPMNYGNINFVVESTYQYASIDFTNPTDLEDATMITGTFVVGAKITPMLGVEGGFVYTKAERDNVNAAGETGEETGYLYYLQAPLKLAKGVTIIPEIGYLDRGDNEVGPLSADLGTQSYFDVNFRIDF